MKFLEAQGFPRNRIIDGRVFKVPNLDFPRLLKEGVAYGVFDNNFISDGTNIAYPRIYQIKNRNLVVNVGKKTYFGGINIETNSPMKVSLNVGKFSSIAWNVTCELIHHNDHNYRNVSSYALWRYDWTVPTEFYPPQGVCKILIGNDVWIGRGCNLKCTNPKKPLVIGDGAVVASDSVVVKNVPPYAIVGGNPAKIIKFRFPEDVIESLLRIKWWDWSLDKIHDNFKYFNDIDKFISLHDK